MEQLLELDKDLFLFLNGLHSQFLDLIMPLLTETYVWTPLYLTLIIIIIRKYKKDSIWILVGVVITIVLSDRITTGFMKPFFERLRPSHEPNLEGLIHIVNGYKGGLYGFASSHAANTFGVATMLWLSLKPHIKGMSLIFLWAIAMSYTRIYLGVHYPSDIIVGALIGLLCGWIAYKVSTYFIQRYTKTPSEF